MTPYEKLKRHRQRKRRGRAVLPIEIDLGAVADILVEGNWLCAWDANDRAKIKQALEAAIAAWAQA